MTTDPDSPQSGPSAEPLLPLPKLKKISSRPVLIFLAVATVIYVVCFLWLLGQTTPCDGFAVISFWGGRSFFPTYLSCMSPNELGDFLAGTFAPLAFLWLAGAVQIQSRELAAQRVELEENRVVMRQQAAESKAATAYIGQQTAILERQEAIRIQEEADEEFDQLLAAYIHVVAFPEGVMLYGEHNQMAGFVPWNWTLASSNDDGEEPAKVLRKIFQRLMLTMQQLEDSTVYRIYSGQAAVVAMLKIGLDEILNTIPRLSPSHRIRAETLPIRQIGHAADDLMHICNTLAIERVAK